MNKDFDFKNIGKETPYSTPEGFFDQITQQTLNEAKRREQRIFSIRKRYWFAAASLTGVAALIVFGLFTNLDKSLFNKNINTDTLFSMSVVTQPLSAKTDSAVSTESGVTKDAFKGDKNEIDKLLSTMSDDEIKLLADMSSNDVFFNQVQQ